MEDFINASLLVNLIDELPTVSTNKIDRTFLYEYCEVMGINFRNPNRNIITLLQSFYRSFGYLPEDLDVLCRYQIETCTCGNIPFEDIPECAKIMSELVKKENRIPGCARVAVYLQYYKQENRLPTDEEISDYINNLNNIENDPEGYHQNNKLKIPTPNLHLLQSEKCCKEDNCGLCMEEISKNEECYKLPCGHIYHSDQDKCISATVKTWLSENKCCPVCKSEVKLS